MGTGWGGDYGTTFVFTAGGLLASGDNTHGQCGVGSIEETIVTPIELPVHVDDIVISGIGVTIIRSWDTLLACGNNEKWQIASNGTRQFTAPTPLDLPGPVVKVSVGHMNVFVQLTDGSWGGRGEYDGDIFFDPDGGWIFVSGWTPVDDTFAGELNAREAGNRVMFLPNPIANK